MSLADSPRYIVVEGPIGVGKTVLAKRLAESFEAQLVLEEPHLNPFLDRFYKDPAGAALPTQLHFLFQRARQIEQLRQDDLFAERRVADFLFIKDLLFAEVTLNPGELDVYKKVYSRVQPEAPDPDLVIYLQAPVDVLLERIRRRGIDYEQRIEAAYLTRIIEAYTRFFHAYDRSPLLIVNAADIDPIHRQADYRALLEAIGRSRRGRHYFNPGRLSQP